VDRSRPHCLQAFMRLTSFGQMTLRGQHFGSMHMRFFDMGDGPPHASDKACETCNGRSHRI